ncbi:MAG: hypothetical protein VX399_10815 [SAR324 cluster bacterium]|nr:hypothetical protein [SAR324 cluster bacterium]
MMMESPGDSEGEAQFRLFQATLFSRDITVIRNEKIWRESFHLFE